MQMNSKAVLGKSVLATIILGTYSFAATVPFTETFANDAANWHDSSGANVLNWTNSGGPDSSGFAFTNFNFSNSAENSTPVIFRGQSEFNSSGGAFVGNWIADGVTTFSADVRQDSGVPLTFFTRFSSSANFPGATAVSFTTVQSGEWTPVSFIINPSSPQFISFEGTDFNTVFSNIGHLQIGVAVPIDLAHADSNVTFGIDNVSIVPEPASFALLICGFAVLARFRSARSACK